ncbi:spermidine synthase [Streptomyces sp. SL13]|uniref:Spermidine synthase n=1 Tax=Streptantibioticus silvisoli TaxID=2705255 RepID=A0AA90H0Y0_9ACTN|nr:spermidine synthase [Streptantibioticus silvisoli]MDI5971274.1 spermidine synthase [Streptantibioticus silvisoli]
MVDHALIARGAVPVRLPVPARLGRALVLAAVFVCAACGLVYELELVALASYLAGTSSVTEASVVLSVMVFAMGVGSLLAKGLRRRAALGFALTEAALALTGGLSAMALYACFAWLGPSPAAPAAFAFAIGVLTGAEIPLLMTLIQRVRRQDAGGAVADLFAADYVGALAGGLAFPFLLLPCLGQLAGALVTGAVNAVAGGAMVLGLFHRDLTARSRCLLLVANLLVLAVLATAAACAGTFERAARDALYGAGARQAGGTGAQEVALTGGTPGRPLRVFVGGRQIARAGSALPAALTDPAMSAGPHRRVLLLGGGDGLTLHRLLAFPGVASVTVVGPDTGLLRAARTDPDLTALNGHAFADPRVRVRRSDPFDWLRTAEPGARYDVVVADLPAPALDPDAYCEEFYGLLRRTLPPTARVAVAAGPPGPTLWTIDAGLRAAGLRTLPYRAGPDGFVLAGERPPALPASATAGVRPVTVRSPPGVPPSTLLRPRFGG